MTPTEFHQTVLHPALHEIAGFAPQMHRTRALDVLMVAISGQEADWQYRSQVPSGMAHGLFQMQLNTIGEIIVNPASAEIFKAGMAFFKIEDATAHEVFAMLADEKADALAVFLARLDLFCNPKPFPHFDEEQAQFEYYANTWRPAHADRVRWARVYALALAAVPVQ
jgi:hypothetical protein